ncbi:MAG: serine hydrolase [Bacteroidota bacterium]
MKTYLLTRISLTFLGLLWTQILIGQNIAISGKWKGLIEIPNMDLEIRVTFQEEGSVWTGTLDIPAQKVKGMELADLKVSKESISFSLPEVPGEAGFIGSYLQNAQRVEGEYSQSGASFPMWFELEQDEAIVPIEKLKPKIQAFIEEGLKRSQTPGLAFALIQAEDVVMAEGFGWRDQGEKLPVSDETLFPIGSISKTFTATGLAMLEEEGKLDMELPIRSYMPEFSLYDEFASRQINVVDLLTHRSGLPRHDLLWYGSTLSRQELLQRLKYLKPNTPFRTKYQYQNLMYMLAGMVTEKVGGSSWESFTKENLFHPLGMTTANFSTTELQKSKNFALPYKLKAQGLTQIPFREATQIGPAGSINANLNDMIKWLQFQMGKGSLEEMQLLSQNQLEKMHSPHVLIPKDDGNMYPGVSHYSYGLGWYIYDYRGLKVIEHGGNIDGFTALIYFIPELKIGMAILSNLAQNPLPEILSKYVTDLVVEDGKIDWLALLQSDNSINASSAAEKISNENSMSPQSHALGSYCGEFKDDGYGIVSIKKDREKLMAQYNDFNFPLQHLHYNIFSSYNALTAEEMKFQFHMNLEGEISAVSINMETKVTPILFRRVPPAKQYDASYLSKLAGNYYLDELLIKVDLLGNKLKLTLPGQSSLELLPYQNDSFKIKDAPGHVLDFVFEGDRVHKILFNEPEGVYTVLRQD